MIWQHPFSKRTISSRFGATANRVNPHRGTDYAPGALSRIPAVTDGKVALIQWSNVLGWVMVQQTADGWFIGYCHLNCATHGINCKRQGCDSPYKNLKVGDALTRGQSVGRVGNTGSASRGAHLHLTLSRDLKGVFAGKVYDIEKHIDKNNK